MDMYTDWGNLKIVSCEACLNGAGPGSSTVFRWNGRIGGVHFWFKPALEPARPRGWEAFKTGVGASIGRSGKHQVL
jgi:hypothetical protein